MAYLLEGPDNRNQPIDTLELTPFKTKLMQVPSWKLKYYRGKGFEGKPTDVVQVAGEDPLDVLIEIVGGEPGLNQTQIVDRAKGSVGKNRVEELLEDRNTLLVKKGQRGNENLYSLNRTGATRF